MATDGSGGEGAAPALEAAKAALALATLTVGRSTLGGLPPTAGLAGFIAACRGFGALVHLDGHKAVVQGVGIGGLVRPPAAIGAGEDDMGAALLAGLAGGHEGGARIHVPGDDVMDLVSSLGATGATVSPPEPDGTVDIRGARDPLPANHGSVSSPAAAVAAMIGALNAAGVSSLETRHPLRGGLEVLLGCFGAGIVVTGGPAVRRLALAGRPELQPQRIDIASLVAGSGRSP
jgi:5-enolpyruvylshikimate-3-phosphate synthase